jgi:hypothetical protein
MPIPPLDVRGVLPEGLHDATDDEIEIQFGSFNGSDVRVRLFERLTSFLAAVRFWGNADEILIDGSFVTSKQRPTDIDIILVYRRDFNLQSEVRPQEYNLVNKTRARRVWGFDIKPVTADSPARDAWIGYFSKDTRSGLEGKGLVRITP